MRVVSYAQLASAAAQVQRHLAALGVERGDRVALSMPNVALMPALYYGIVAAGAICVPLNPLLSGAELEYHLRDSGAKVLFAFAGTRLASEAILDGAGEERFGSLRDFHRGRGLAGGSF